MVEIRLTDTLTRGKVDLAPIDPTDVRMYLCGPTVYDRAHLGNARPVVVFDVLYRLLRYVYGADHVSYVRNFTDVDDKINARAAAIGRPIREITDETIGWYHADMDALGALRPSLRGEVTPAAEPRATDYIAQMIAMIQELIADRHAYVAEGHVLFDVRSFPAYGRLSGRSVDDMIAGARVEVAPFKRDSMDFVLWKPSDATTPGWESPWGRGRPGWHIECSAMASALLGDSFDIHAGGIDLQFPHHENELAQSRCAYPDADFARIWLHNEMLQVEGKKMSKSLGNFFTVRDLLDQGVAGAVIRYVFLMTHYRKPMDWTADKVREGRRTLADYAAQTRTVAPADQIAPGLIEALADDLNTSEYLRLLKEFSKTGRYRDLKAGLEFIGLSRTDTGSAILDEPDMPDDVRNARRDYARVRAAVWHDIAGDHPPDPVQPGDESVAAYQAAICQLVRDAARHLGVQERVISSFDTDSTLTRQLALAADQADIPGLIDQRRRARQDKDYALADALRVKIAELGIELRDTAAGTVWRGVQD
ncbi:cysteine--tRNA ligase [uncultured Paracoccus sp.]|uniref:cysteine--tRNA ligase n=1 Tax=uncultured Paracoccus sp. TaxID=189685 RepID=UPI00261880F1|nr:cysteine--tRNA ligase [uncultured Paracoccus sp.]